MHLTEDEIALFSAFVLMSAGKITKSNGFSIVQVKNFYKYTTYNGCRIFRGIPRETAILVKI